MEPENMKAGNEHILALMHAERAALAEDLQGLTAEHWNAKTLCGQWDVEDVVAHLTAAASTNQWQWMRSIIGASFRPSVHNQSRLAEHRGNTAAETLDNFRAIISSNTLPSKHLPAYLGEVIVHAQDIRYPLGINRAPSVEALTIVADFYIARNFAVRSHTYAAGLRLQATDGPFVGGAGPLIAGPTVALVMSMAGRTAYLNQLEGEGVQILAERLPNA